MTDAELDKGLDEMVKSVLDHLDGQVAGRSPNDAMADRMTALGGALGLVMYSISPTDPTRIAQGVTMMAVHITEVAMALYNEDNPG